MLLKVHWVFENKGQSIYICGENIKSKIDMAEINIPKSHQETLVFYATLSKSIKSKLIEQIKLSSLGLTPHSFTEFLSLQIPISKDKIDDILEIVFNLINAKEAIGVDLNGFMDILEKALVETKNEKLLPNEAILSDLKALMSANGANALATPKIVSSITDQSQVYLDSKITNDVRPILDDNNTLIGSVMIHQLKIIFKTGEDTKEAFFSLDDNDLNKLCEKLTQAEAQSKIIKAHFSNSVFINIA